jgi:hypothetical protein
VVALVAVALAVWRKAAAGSAGMIDLQLSLGDRSVGVAGRF